MGALEAKCYESTWMLQEQTTRMQRNLYNGTDINAYNFDFLLILLLFQLLNGCDVKNSTARIGTQEIGVGFCG
jgi:hypothetical protein